MSEQVRVVTQHCRGLLFIAFEGPGRQSITFISNVKSSSIQRSLSNDAKKFLINARHLTHSTSPTSHQTLGKPNRHNDLRQRLFGLTIPEPGGKCTGRAHTTETISRHPIIMSIDTTKTITLKQD